MKNLSPNEKLLNKISELYQTEKHNISFIMPRAYDLSVEEIRVKDIVLLPDKTKVMLRGTMTNFRVKSAGRFTFIYADIHNSFGEKQICQWASSNKQAYSKMIALSSELSNSPIQLYASITSFEGNTGRVVFLNNCKFTKIGSIESCGSIPSPIYTLKDSIKPYELTKAIDLAIDKCCDDKYSMSKEMEIILDLCSLKTALLFIHGKKVVDTSEVNDFNLLQSQYHKRITVEKIYRTLARLKDDKTRGSSPVITYSRPDMIRLENSLPYNLTLEQKKALGEIFKIFSSGEFKTILLQGDVGSGKTATSVFACVSVVKKDKQVAVLAPSSVLAEQLFNEYSEMLKIFNIEVCIAAGKMTKKYKDSLQKKIDSNRQIVVIGTTAVNNFSFTNLGLVVIDEEQKFGVDAKRALLKNIKNLPYQIYMSATPLPRSIQSSIYGNYEVVKIAAKPKGRIDVKSKIIHDDNTADRLLKFIESEAKQGRVSLIVAPSINSGELASVEKISNICATRYGNNFFKVIHGQMKENEIKKNIKEFREGKFPLMIATSMVEAGFSHVDLSVVVVLGPDRFGLAQLHQLRGRAGRRAGLCGYCALWPLDSQLKDKAIDRLEYFCKNFNGFDLANKDLSLRGGGDLVGKIQSGGEINFIEHTEIINKIKTHL